MNNILRITVLVVAVIIFVSLFLYLIDEKFNSLQESSVHINPNYSISFFEKLNTIPDFDEQERIESLTGLNTIMYVFYALLLVINISFLWIIKQDESAAKIIIYGLYASISLILFINLILHANQATWSFKHAFGLTLKGVGASLLASLISICIYSVKNVFNILKEESKSILVLITDKILSPNINTSLAISRVWIIFTLIVSIFFIGLFLV